MPGVKDWLDPVCWVWGMNLALGVGIWWSGRRQMGGFLAGLMVLWSLMEWLQVPARLLAGREAAFVKVSSEIEDVDAVVMLGGVLYPSPMALSGADYLSSVDRLHCAVILARRLEVPLVMGGGVAGNRTSLREPDYERRLLTELGVDVVTMDLGDVVNTRDEVDAAKRMAESQGWEKVALVTSAWHLRRAMKLCENVGLSAVPRGCDYRGHSEWHEDDRKWVPSSDSAQSVRLWLSEWVGERYYRFRGWL